MAALTPTTGTYHVINAGNRRERLAQFASVSNNDTYTTDLNIVDAVQLSFIDAAAVAADSIAATVSGSVITFAVAGTARAVQLVLWGRI